MTTVFPSSTEELGRAFDNAIADKDCPMQRDRRDVTTFFLRFEFLASDSEDGTLTHDWFVNSDTKEYFRVPRTGELE